MSPGSSSRAGRDSRRQLKAGIRRTQARIARPLRGESPDSSVLFGALPSELRFSRAEKRLLTDFARELSRRIVPGRVFDCLIADDAELHRLNLAFLGNDYPTDVLSFPNESLAAKRCLVDTVKKSPSLRAGVAVAITYKTALSAGFWPTKITDWPAGRDRPAPIHFASRASGR
jgi:hypothetical protein